MATRTTTMRTGPTALALRSIGVVLLAFAMVAGAALAGSLDTHPAADATAFDCLLALATFAGGSAGLALVVLGRRLLDEVAVSSPWMRCRDASATLPPRAPRHAIHPSWLAAPASMARR